MSAVYTRPAASTIPDAYRTLAEHAPREPLHAHDVVTTIHVLEGVVYLIADEDERPMTPGDQAVIAPGVSHRIFNGGDGVAHVLEGLRPEHCA